MPGYRARKRFGQNFLVSTDVVQRIVDLISPRESDTIVEVGPGQGALTVPLAESGARLVAVDGSGQDVIAVGRDGSSWHSWDLGASWLRAAHFVPAAMGTGFEQVRFSGPGEATAVGWDGALLTFGPG